MIILGISGIMSQMILMPTLIPYFGEYKLLSFSLFAGFLSMLIDSITWAQWVPYIVSMFSIFHIMETPCLRSIVSKQFGRDEQGMAQGCISSITSFANIISPLIFSPLTDLFLSDKAPFYYPGFNFLCMAIGMVIISYIISFLSSCVHLNLVLCAAYSVHS
ncbi:quinolone resistance protein NorA-like [Impatiens glandulifera]|uniref:quinolone resistance protein NorA-like n=1 Tax=Impatiens glandulifera TaxID=253017 RepID=UPI001FB19B0D|nr:quinolone resistance protein NorA-like [Impatiens glandulifera]